MDKIQAINFAKFLNALNLIGISSVLAIAFLFQIALGELPCPLCLLQRIGLLSIAFGFLLNVHYQIRPGHYALSLLASVFTGIAAMRQVTMNALPPHGYGFPILGIHLYTWTAFLCLAMVIYISVLISLPGQYQQTSDQISEAKTPWIRTLGHIAFGFLLLMLLGNIVSTYLECGLQECSGNFLTYKI